MNIIHLINLKSMSKTEFTPEKKIKWISRMYFGVADSPSHDVNPFDDLTPFLEATVQQLDWGKNTEERTIAKEKFCLYFMRILDLYDFSIPKEEILKCLSNESMKNKDVVQHLASIGFFPSK